MKASECEYCSGEIRQKKVTVDHWYKEKLVIIKDVPVGVCQECGQRYYAAATLDRLILWRRIAIPRRKEYLSQSW